MVHIGEKIQDVQRNSGLSVTAFAQKINCSRRNVYAIFDKPSIDTSLLLRIGTVLDHDFFRYFISAEEPSANGSMEAEGVRMAQLEKEVTYLSEINQLLRKSPEQANKQTATPVGWKKRS